ncbi:hypothetical protein [Streptomyces sp. NPDC056817]|uniref:hypothetical protein n=1 Tax=Streptomyces sp. NPDC056817 TaxID=3345950 RepID=UPI0036B86248
MRHACRSLSEFVEGLAEGESGRASRDHRKTVTGLADRLPVGPPDLPEHPEYPRILAVFNEATGPLRARDVCEALDHELLPKNIEGTGAKLKRLVKLGILTEADTGSFTGSP